MNWEAILIVILGGFNVTQLIVFLITRHDERKKGNNTIQKELKELKLATTRIQLLFLTKLCPEQAQEIMTIAEHYFKDLQGDWYMTSVFYQWLEQSETAKPDWFDKTK